MKYLMGKPTGFLEIDRQTPSYRPVEERIQDWKEIPIAMPEDQIRQQGARCMECGIPFCLSGCPLGNLIPDWNDLVYRNRWREAIDQLHSTNNFPEFTGRVCPAPCEQACVLNLPRTPVTIKNIELTIVEHAFAEGWIRPQPPARRTGRKVAVVGAGPAGLACAQQLTRAGHDVTVYEKDNRVGGLLMFGIPDFKLEKHIVQRRIDQMVAEGVRFVRSCHVGRDVPARDLLAQYDAVCLTMGSRRPRDLDVPGRELDGVHFAMEFLEQQNRRVAGDDLGGPVGGIVGGGVRSLMATGKHVVILGGGDTGADCLGTALRQGAAEIRQFELLPCPPDEPAPNTWPHWPNILRSSTAHEEGGLRDWSILTKSLSGRDGRVEKLHAVRIEWSEPDASGRRSFKEIPGSEFTVAADLVLLAMGYVHVEHNGLLDDLGVAYDARGNIRAGTDYKTSVDKVFTAGDARFGQSLVVWAIYEGREAAHHIDTYLMGHSDLPLRDRGPFDPFNASVTGENATAAVSSGQSK